eukprot:TRINITY_DN33832_c0_g1_i1.p1 TRINITY_DN33832_c0_g1~~TRINITY_DN33832_c0_g1_i1.p1  ORF type:complete len:409 (+),score=40.30 TRINITY_DN33832_c0_g1_i1:112-1338(+)
MVGTAAMVVPCHDLDPMLVFLTELGFRVDIIRPADCPQTAILSAYGLRIELRVGHGNPGVLHIERDGPSHELVAPNGMRVEISPPPSVVLPPLRPSVVIRQHSSNTWGRGRAGMRYRDLLPGRQGGRFIASQIHIPAGGDVPDSVHSHSVKFQLIYCISGWARLVYEDQGPPFTLHGGECILQPPGIRHKVIAAGAGLHVLEFGCPAEHETIADHQTALPNTSAPVAGRTWHGQHFVHSTRTAEWVPWRIEGFAALEFGIRHASGGLVSVSEVRLAADVTSRRLITDSEPSMRSGLADPPSSSRQVSFEEDASPWHTHTDEGALLFVLHGHMTIDLKTGAPDTAAATTSGDTTSLGAAPESATERTTCTMRPWDSVWLPARTPHRLQMSPNSALVEIRVPHTCGLSYP